MPDIPTQSADNDASPNPAKRLNPLLRRQNKKVTIIVIAVVAIVAIAVLGFFLFRTSDNGNGLSLTGGDRNQAYRRIDGVAVDRQESNLAPVAIMVENIVESRPQAGLDKAQLVYEALVEGGITRFMAVYADAARTPEIGPVRSARPYYLDWAKGLNALYMHVGGSPTSLSQIETKDVNSLNQFYNSQYYWRSSDRIAPHNLYTSGELKAYAVRDEGLSSGSYDAWTFADTGTSSTDAQKVQIDFSSFSYLVEWEFDPATKTYSRAMAGEPHVMANDSAITASNVIIQFVKTSLEDATRLSMETVGSGQAIIVTNGTRTDGTWKKNSVDERTMFFDGSGDPVTLSRGTTWVEVLPTDRTVTIN